MSAPKNGNCAGTPIASRLRRLSSGHNKPASYCSVEVTGLPRGDRLDIVFYLSSGFQRPRNMFAHQRRGIIHTPPQRGGQLIAQGGRQQTAQRIAQCNRNITQPALMADAANCRATEPSIEFVGAPGKYIDEGGVVQAIAHVKVIASRHLRKFIPRTDELTIIAAVNAIADEDRKSTRLNSSHQIISYAVFCL